MTKLASNFFHSSQGETPLACIFTMPNAVKQIVALSTTMLQTSNSGNRLASVLSLFSVKKSQWERK